MRILERVMTRLQRGLWPVAAYLLAMSLGFLFAVFVIGR